MNVGKVAVHYRNCLYFLSIVLFTYNKNRLSPKNVISSCNCSCNNNNYTYTGSTVYEDEPVTLLRCACPGIKKGEGEGRGGGD